MGKSNQNENNADEDLPVDLYPTIMKKFAGF